MQVTLQLNKWLFLVEIVDICNALQLDLSLFQKILTQKIVKNQHDVFIAELSASSVLFVVTCLLFTRTNVILNYF